MSTWSSLMPEGLNSFMGIWILFSALVYGVYEWLNPSGAEGWWKTRGFFEPVDSSFFVLIIWLLITYGLHSVGIFD